MHLMPYVYTVKYSVLILKVPGALDIEFRHYSIMCGVLYRTIR